MQKTCQSDACGLSLRPRDTQVGITGVLSPDGSIRPPGADAGPLQLGGSQCSTRHSDGEHEQPWVGRGWDRKFTRRLVGWEVRKKII